MKDILIWVAIWFLTLLVFNFKLNWNKAKTFNQRYVYTSLFFVIVSCVVYKIISKSINIEVYPVFVGSIIAMTIGIFLSNYYPYYKHIISGKYFLVSLVFDILFQQIMIVAGIKVLEKYFALYYSDFYFGILFMIGHLPVIFLKWAKLRYFYLIATFFGGTIFSYLISKYTLGTTFSFLIHYFIYVIIFYYLKDERKI